MMNEEVIKQFGANAAAYVNSTVHAKGASLQRLVALLRPQNTWQVLDVATGAGHTAFAVAPFVEQVVATDITPQMLANARRLGQERGLSNVSFELADAGELPFEEGRFDVVTCRIAAHHFGDVRAFVEACRRVLRPDGLLAVVDNIVPPGAVGDYVNALEKLRDPSHLRCLSLEAWRSVLQEANFSLIAEETLAKRLDFSFWAQRHDPPMRGYVRALISEAGTGPAAFLDPRESGGELSFRLVEGILIARAGNAH